MVLVRVRCVRGEAEHGYMLGAMYALARMHNGAVNVQYHVLQIEAVYVGEDQKYMVDYVDDGGNSYDQGNV